ncbi:hypothetical protein BGZ94_005061, partial [Podila epigama]
MNQSPIDISRETRNTIVHDAIQPMIMDYKPLNGATAHWNGHTVEVDLDASSAKYNNTVTLNGKQFNLIQFHFHTPSEHRIDGRHADAELHLVHRSPKDQSIAVISLLLEADVENAPMFDFVNVLHRRVDA